MYKVFVNEKVIFFTNNEENCNQFNHKLVLNFFSIEDIPFVLELLYSNDKMSVIIIVIDYKTAFETFKSYFKIIKAAGGIVNNSKNEKLFIYRLDKWDLPKGKIEKGEETKVAAIREIEEECGIADLTIIKQLKDTFHIYTFKEQLILKQTYWFELTSSFGGELIPQLEEGITKVEWLTDAEINDKVLKNTYASIKELL
ncbi:MAG: NUDIX domain-containing protein [Flavobacteriales bacterium]|nr:NUDIX domain-containing protein [Flavobacteriales bacterium]NQX98529.1 NUDIX domain-containing protein [Flavobacteriales bacterium]